jgi:glycosyltransferase involved in cell wall biosynthesis
LYDKCQALIYPSFSGPENLPPLEAMARKKPVIISKYPGSKEQLGKLVFYFNPNKATSLIKQVVKTINLIKNKKLLKKIVKENYNLVKKKSTKNYIGNINYYLK